MTTKVVLPEHVVGAIRLALEGAANPDTAVRVIDRLCDMAGALDDEATEPTKLLVEAIQELQGTFEVRDPA